MTLESSKQVNCAGLSPRTFRTLAREFSPARTESTDDYREHAADQTWFCRRRGAGSAAVRFTSRQGSAPAGPQPAKVLSD